MAKFSQAFNYPQQQLGALLSSLGMTPHDTSTSGQTNFGKPRRSRIGRASISRRDQGCRAEHLQEWRRRTELEEEDIEPVGQGPGPGIPVLQDTASRAARGVRPRCKDRWPRGVQKVVPEAVKARSQARAASCRSTCRRSRPRPEASARLCRRHRRWFQPSLVEALFRPAHLAWRRALAPCRLSGPRPKFPRGRDDSCDAEAVRLWGVGRRRSRHRAASISACRWGGGGGISDLLAEAAGPTS